MRKAFVLMVMLSLLVMFSGAVLAGEFCSYGTHAKKTITEKTDATKTVATKTAPQVDSEKLLLAQTEEAATSAPAKKK